VISSLDDHERCELRAARRDFGVGILAASQETNKISRDVLTRRISGQSIHARDWNGRAMSESDERDAQFVDFSQ
jgi:hypothetical protein